MFEKEKKKRTGSLAVRAQGVYTQIPRLRSISKSIIQAAIHFKTAWEQKWIVYINTCMWHSNTQAAGCVLSGHNLVTERAWLHLTAILCLRVLQRQKEKRKKPTKTCRQHKKNQSALLPHV